MPDGEPKSMLRARKEQMESLFSRGDDMPILHYLQQHQSELYARLRQNVARARQVIE